MILEVRGSLDQTQKTTRLTRAFNGDNTIKLIYAHLPPLSLTPAFPTGINIDDGEQTAIYNIPACPSYAALANELDKLLFGGQRILHVFYDNGSFEINTNAVDINFSPDFADFLKFPVTVPSEKTYASNLDASHTHHFSHYAVVVKQTKGTFDGIGFDECVGRIRRDGKIIAGEHHFTGPVIDLDVAVHRVDIGGGGETVYTANEWAVGFELK